MGSFYAVFLPWKKSFLRKKANFPSFWELFHPTGGYTQYCPKEDLGLSVEENFSSFRVLYQGKSSWTFLLKIFKLFFLPTRAGVKNVLVNQTHNLLFKVNTVEFIHLWLPGLAFLGCFPILLVINSSVPCSAEFIFWNIFKMKIVGINFIQITKGSFWSHLVFLGYLRSST